MWFIVGEVGGWDWVVGFWLVESTYWNFLQCHWTKTQPPNPTHPFTNFTAWRNENSAHPRNLENSWNYSHMCYRGRFKKCLDIWSKSALIYRRKNDLFGNMCMYMYMCTYNVGRDTATKLRQNKTLSKATNHQVFGFLVIKEGKEMWACHRRTWVMSCHWLWSLNSGCSEETK